jgi:long-chain fatty acid transport protein
MLRSRIPALLITVTLASEARAGGFLSSQFDGELGSATTDSLSAIYFNPAALSLQPGTRVQLTGTVGYHWASYDRPVGAIDNVVPPGTSASGTPGSAVTANTGVARALNFASLPFAALASDFGVKGLAAAMGFFVPFGGVQSWDKNNTYRGNLQYPGAVDGPQRWSMIDGDLRSYYVSAAISYTIARAHLSLGVAGNLVYNTLSTVRARTAAGTDDLVSATGQILEGRTQLDASGLTGSLGVGLLWQPRPSWWLAISYQSQPGFGQMTMTGTLRNKFGTGAVNEQAVDLQQSYPDILRIALAVRPRPAFELRLWGEYQRWSVMDNQCLLDRMNPQRRCRLNPDGSVDAARGGAGIILVLPRHWSDGYALHVGATWFAKKWFELQLGATFDANVVPDSTLDPAFIDQNKVLAVLGARFKMLRDRLSLGLTWTQVIYLARTAPTAPRNAMNVRLGEQPPSRNPDGAGRYQQSVGLFTLSLAYRFR